MAGVAPGAALPAPGSLGAWWLAARPRTLPAALAPIAVGTATAAVAGGARPGRALLALVTALLLQIGSNLANDVYDFERGTDDEERRGPVRAAQAGLLTPAALRFGMLAVLTAAALCGLGLVAVGGWPLLVAGALALLAAWAYTGGPALGYRGLGDALVFLFFGVVGVAGTHYLQTGGISTLAAVAALPVGCLATAILAVNNLRDLDGDRRAGKRTLAVRLGGAATRRYYGFLVGFAFVSALALGPLGGGWGVLLVLAAAPTARALVGRVADPRRDAELNPVLAETARLGLVVGLLLALGIAA